mmetsp:Transcript_21010/g.45818  ORF Transcript_21010/g.45818 Transcript_21010/m.45818 type:complete len:223 (+) Transcript_21010:59-727(+)
MGAITPPPPSIDCLPLTSFTTPLPPPLPSMLTTTTTTTPTNTKANFDTVNAAAAAAATKGRNKMAIYTRKLPAPALVAKPKAMRPQQQQLLPPPSVCGGSSHRYTTTITTPTITNASTTTTSTSTSKALFKKDDATTASGITTPPSLLMAPVVTINSKIGRGAFSMSSVLGGSAPGGLHGHGTDACAYAYTSSPDSPLSPPVRRIMTSTMKFNNDDDTTIAV